MTTHPPFPFPCLFSHMFSVVSPQQKTHGAVSASTLSSWASVKQEGHWLCDVPFQLLHYKHLQTQRHHGLNSVIKKKKIEADTLSSVHTTCSASGPCLNDCHLGQKLKCFFQIHSLITCLCVTVKRQVSQDTGARQR